MTLTDPNEHAEILSQKNFLIKGRKIFVKKLLAGDDLSEFKSEVERRRVFIAGLPYSFGNDDLRELLERFGVLEDAFVAREVGLRHKSRGFGYATFQKVEGAKRALDEGKMSYKNYQIKILRFKKSDDGGGGGRQSRVGMDPNAPGFPIFDRSSYQITKKSKDLAEGRAGRAGGEEEGREVLQRGGSRDGSQGNEGGGEDGSMLDKSPLLASSRKNSKSYHKEESNHEECFQSGKRDFRPKSHKKVLKKLKNYRKRPKIELKFSRSQHTSNGKLSLLRRSAPSEIPKGDSNQLKMIIKSIPLLALTQDRRESAMLENRGKPFPG